MTEIIDLVEEPIDKLIYHFLNFLIYVSTFNPKMHANAVVA